MFYILEEEKEKGGGGGGGGEEEKWGRGGEGRGKMWQRGRQKRLSSIHPYMHTCVHPADYSPIHACIDLYRTPRTELGMRCLTLNKTILILALSKLRVL